MNYQAKWVVYRAWCRRQGHSVSRSSISKVADFLLYLCCSLCLSYSSIASYHSMLSSVFCFVLPSLSSHAVLHDLLRSFQIEHPLPSSRIPPWDLLWVLSFLRGPPFEPLSCCYLKDLSHKVLFLIALATAIAWANFRLSSVSFSGSGIFLFYLPEFWAKSESASNPLPRSFRVRSLNDFVGDLQDESLLCPVRALHVYLHRTSSICLVRVLFLFRRVLLLVPSPRTL